MGCGKKELLTIEIDEVQAWFQLFLMNSLPWVGNWGEIIKSVHKNVLTIGGKDNRTLLDTDYINK